MLQSGFEGCLEDVFMVVLSLMTLATVLLTRDAGYYLLGRSLLIMYQLNDMMKPLKIADEKYLACCNCTEMNCMN